MIRFEKEGPIFAEFKPGVTRADVERAVADDCFLLPPDAEAEIPSGAWVTIVGSF